MKHRCRLNPLSSLDLDIDKILREEAFRSKNFQKPLWMEKDVKALASKANVAKIEQMFQRSPFRWRVAFLTRDINVLADEEPGTISVVLYGSSGDVMTAWMTAHRISHSISEYLILGPDVEVKGEVSAFYRRARDLISSMGGRGDYSHLLTMRSARAGKIQDSTEAKHELLAQYIHDGRITLGEDHADDAEQLNRAAHEMLKAIERHGYTLYDEV